MRNLRDELNSMGDNQYHPAWRPEIGDIFVGHFVRYERAITKKGPRFIAVAKEQDTGQLVSIWLTSVVLRERFKDRRPMPGERFGIRRLPDSGRGYQRYVVVVDRNETEEPDFFKTDKAADRNSDQPRGALNDDDIPF